MRFSLKFDSVNIEAAFQLIRHFIGLTELRRTLKIINTVVNRSIYCNEILRTLLSSNYFVFLKMFCDLHLLQRIKKCFNL